MDIQTRISRQRVKHIVDSYQLEGDDANAFVLYLASLLDEYRPALIELAMVEAIVESWSVIPLLRGTPFLEKVHKRLNQWRQSPIESSLSPAHFEQITGLDAVAVFGPHPWPQPLSPQGASEAP
ncbi:MAG: hypothetical protein AAF152_13065 [Cyanobacteria bacterium P01_A01_bin.114]